MHKAVWDSASQTWHIVVQNGNQAWGHIVAPEYLGAWWTDIGLKLLGMV